MEPCIVSYFPGAGGFRFIYHLLGKSFDQNPQGNYHGRELISNSSIYHNSANQYRYPTLLCHNVIKDPAAIAYTHAINTNLIKKMYPGRKIIKIKTNLPRSLMRFWNVYGQERHGNSIASLGWEQTLDQVLMFHYEYYRETGVDWAADQVIDINTDTSDFSVFMRDQFAQHASPDLENYVKNWQWRHRLVLAF